MTAEWTEEQRLKVVAANFIRFAVENYLPTAAESPEVGWLLTDDSSFGSDAPLEKYRQLFLALEELGYRSHCRGAYWRTLMRAASTLGFEEIVALFRQRFSEALRRIGKRPARQR